MSGNADQQNVVRIGLVQHGCGLDVGENVEKAVGMVRRAAGLGAQVVVLQELFGSRYFPQEEDSKYFDLAEGVPGGATVRRLCEVAGELGVVVVGSVFERRAAGVYHNTAVVVGADGDGGGGCGEVIGVYRKMHIPDDPRFYEKFYFTPGDAPGWRVHEMGGVGGGLRGGVLVCWDQWFPEAARLTSMMGAQVLFYPTAIGWWEGEDAGECEAQLDAWLTVQRSHAIANGVYVVAVNRVGVEGELRFWGSSFVVDPGGRVIGRASGEDEQVLVVDCDLSEVERVRRDWPFFRDRRVDAFGGLMERYLDADKCEGE